MAISVNIQVAMGSPPSLVIANCYMEYFKEHVMGKVTLKLSSRNNILIISIASIQTPMTNFNLI
jgi:hypothetical protein